MVEQRNKVIIDLKVNSDVTKQLEKIRKTSQASFVATPPLRTSLCYPWTHPNKCHKLKFV
jgi:hypothetical protein